MPLPRKGGDSDAAFAPIPRTTPAMASLFTGVDPGEHKVTDVGGRLASVETVAKAFRDRGFQTTGLSANRFASLDQGFDQGFDAFLPMHDADAGQVVREALTQRDAGRAQFMWVHLMDPHWPYGTTGACADLVDLGPGEVHADATGRASRAAAACRTAYEAEVRFVDEAIGRLFEAFEGQPIVVVGDHGENLGEEGLFYAHGPSLAEASTRVPLIVRQPGTSPAEFHHLMGLADVGRALRQADLDALPLRTLLSSAPECAPRPIRS